MEVYGLAPSSSESRVDLRTGGMAKSCWEEGG
jgi:hypothetical protein